MHKLPKLINFVKALQIQTPIFTYPIPKKELLFKCSPLWAEAQLRLLHTALCLLLRSLRLNSAFQESNNFTQICRAAGSTAPLTGIPTPPPGKQVWYSSQLLLHYIQQQLTKMPWDSFTRSYSGKLLHAEITRGNNFHFSLLLAPCTAPQKANLGHCSLAFPTVQMFVCFLSMKLINGT